MAVAFVYIRALVWFSPEQTVMKVDKILAKYIIKISILLTDAYANNFSYNIPAIFI